MILGIDTSCYTTSIALIEAENGNILADHRRLLVVKFGEKGLRQSEAVFQHLNNIPELINSDATEYPITAVAVSAIPRPIPDSYLPVFKVGTAFGEAISKIKGVPLIKTSHQEGHIRAGLFQQEDKVQAEFLAWHISGGTTELLRVKPNGFGFQVDKVGGSTDLHIGQFVDRVGVALGESFPAGPHLERLAFNSNSSKSLPITARDLTISFSGPASAAERLINEKIPKPDIARMVFNTLGKVLLKVSSHAAKVFGIYQVLLVGGVASSQIIREMLTQEATTLGINFIFGPPELSSDNAVGVGLIGRDCLKGKSNNG